MRNTTRILSFVGFGMLMSTAAWAQEAAPAPAAPAAEPAPAAAPAPAEAAPAPAAGEQTAQASGEVAPAEMSASAEVAEEPAPAEEAPAMEEAPMEEAPAAVEEAPAEEGSSTPGWFRVDSDGLGLQLWFGATHDLGGVGLATDIYIDSGTLAEFDLGVEIPIGESVLLIPMVGLALDWSEMRPTTLVAPQLFAYLDFSPVYIEYWGQFFFTSPLASDDVDSGDGATSEKDAAGDTMYNRLQLFFNISDTVALGPQVEATVALNDAAGDGLTSLPVGLGTNIGYGENNTLGLWLGYETKKDARVAADELGGGVTERGIVGRFTFVKTW